MRIPSYDDLTPSIPDITARETLGEIGNFLPHSEPPDDVERPAFTARQASTLYACLRHGRSTLPPHLEPPSSFRSRLRQHASPHFAIARDFSPRIQCHGDAAVVLDISGLGRLLGNPQTIGAELARAADGCGVRVAIARSQTAARLLAIAHPGPAIADGEAAGAIALLPLDTIRMFVEDDQVGNAGAAARLKATVDRLDTFRRWGLTTLGEVAALPSLALSERMGQEGLALQQLARGVDREPLVPDPGVPRFLQSIELEWPIDALEPLSFVLARLLDPLSTMLERADRGAAAIRLDLRLVDRTMHTRVLQLPAAMRDAKVFRTLLLLDLESHPPAAAIDIVTIEIDPLPGRIVQYSLLERALPSPETLATLTARLGALVGDDRCGSPALLDTWRPDGFEMRRFAPSAASSQLPAGPERAGADASRRAGPERAVGRASRRAPGARSGYPHPPALPSANRGPRHGGARPSRPRRDRSSWHAGRARRMCRRSVAYFRCVVGSRICCVGSR